MANFLNCFLVILSNLIFRQISNAIVGMTFEFSDFFEVWDYFVGKDFKQSFDIKLKSKKNWNQKFLHNDFMLHQNPNIVCEKFKHLCQAKNNFYTQNVQYHLEIRKFNIMLDNNAKTIFMVWYKTSSLPFFCILQINISMISMIFYD